MDYLIMQMLFCLLIAAIIGFIIGWLLKSLFCRKYQDELRRLESNNGDLNAKITKLASERDQFREKALDLEASASSLGVGDVDGPKDVYDIQEIEGIGLGYGKLLRAMDIATTRDLLDKANTSAIRQEIASAMKLQEFVIGKWVSMADLIRVKGIRGQFAELLEASGITSVQQLAQQDATVLTAKMEVVNAKEHRTRVNPSREIVSDWIEQAKSLAAST